MKNKLRILIPLCILAAIVLVTLLFIRSNEIAVLSPSGIIAGKQRNLLVFATLLGMVVVIPVFVMTGYFAWRYRASNQKATYKPDWDKNLFLEAVWWGIPIIIIVILSVVTWRSTHELDPYRALDSEKKPIRIQVVALQWKWLFIYPEQGIATVNYIQFPEDTPLNFEITADAPMNSFWIPKLGGQIYAMNGMVTKLHLQADEPGEYDGVSANISGEGFSGMRFKARATSTADFDAWINTARRSEEQLTKQEYTVLTQPTKDHPVVLYATAEHDLYDTIIGKYMDHAHGEPEKTQDEVNGGHQH